MSAEPKSALMSAAVTQTDDFMPGATVGRWSRPDLAPRGSAFELAWSIQPVEDSTSISASVLREEVVPRARSEAASRALNVTIALLAIVTLAPVIALVAVIIKLTSKGPVFYSQTRVGIDLRYRSRLCHERRQQDLGGRLFRIYKFRTMRTDAESDGRAVWAQRADPRVTVVGRVLRRMRLDELPQLYNVLRGDMNIVGPRPERPCIFAQLREDIPEYPARQRVKPGITGWAQINQAYDACVDDVRRKVQYDIAYLRRQSLMEDLRIMSMTIPVMLFRKGGW